MKKRIYVTAIALVAAALLSLTGYFILSAAQNSTTAIPDAKKLYKSSLSNISDAQDLLLKINKTQAMTVGSSIFYETSQQTRSYAGIGLESMRIGLTETLSIDNYDIQISEVFTEGTVYTELNGSCFSGKINMADYLVRLSPAILINADLYESITATDTGNGYAVDFKQPYAAESWAMADTCTFVDATGTAYISYEGRLTKSIYNLTYDLESIRFQTSWTVEPNLSSGNVEIPKDTSLYTPIDYLDGPFMLERASGYLLQSKNISGYYSDSIYFQAFGDARTQNITIHTAAGNAWSALVDTQTVLKNDSRVDQDSQLQKTELYTDNVYYVSTNGSETTANLEVSADAMRSYCRNLLVGTVMLPQYVAGAQFTESDGVLHIVFSASDAYSELISSNAGQTMYQQPELLNKLAQSSTTDTLQCYLDLDKNTGLPVGSGIHYSGTYTIEGIPYELRYKADQAYHISSQNAEAEINKAAGA